MDGKLSSFKDSPIQRSRLRLDRQSDVIVELQVLLKKDPHHIWNQQLPERKENFSDNHLFQS